MNLNINLLSPNLTIPKNKKALNIWVNMYGIEQIGIDRLKYMADLFMAHPDAARLIVNCKEELKVELEVFRRIHNVRFMEK